MKILLGILRVIVWCVYALTILAIVVLGFAFVLLMLGASTKAGFTELVYRLASPFFGPFEGMIEPTKLANGGIMSWSVLIAMAAYAVAGAFIGGLLHWITRKMVLAGRPKVAPASTATSSLPVGPTPAPAPAPAEASAQTAVSDAPAEPASGDATPVAQPAPTATAVPPAGETPGTGA